MPYFIIYFGSEDMLTRNITVVDNIIYQTNTFIGFPSFNKDFEFLDQEVFLFEMPVYWGLFKMAHKQGFR
eukprot:snap_masked-scaffold_33-processed-gene-2.41-mRNA-1 protein AED:1.00 eAED:1.00 QI:0/0/0/0/1/1/4/0/69